MTLQVSRWWRLLRAISIHNIPLRSGSVAADTGGARDRWGPGRTHPIDTARWEDLGNMRPDSGAGRGFRMHAPSMPDLVRMGILCSIYVSAAKLGLSLDAVSGFAAAVWPPTGIGLVALTLFGYRLWPGIALGAFLVNASAGAPVLVALGMAIGNTLEAVVGAYLLQHVVGFQPALTRLRDVFGLVILAAGLSTLVSATLGVTSGWLGGVIPSTSYGQAWWTWWLGDLMGDLVVAPLLWVWRAPPRLHMPRRQLAEAGALLVCTVAVSLFVFGGPWAMRTMTYLYLLFPLLIWAAFRFGPHGAVVTISLVSAIAIWGTVHGFGHFASQTLHAGLFELQAFMSSVAVTSLILAAALAERQHLEEARAQLEAIVESSDDAIIGTTLAGIIISWNRGAERIYGYAADEVIGRPIAILIPPDRPDELPEILAGLTRGEHIGQYETVRMRKDGQAIYVSLTISPVRDAMGSIIGTSAVVQDITARKHAEEALELQRRDTAFLDRATQLFNSTLQLDAVLQRVVQMATEVLGESCTINLIEEGKEHLRPVATYHPDPEISRAHWQVLRDNPIRVGDSASVVGLAAANGQPYLVKDVPMEVPVQHADHLRIYSLIAAPMIARGKILGVLATSIMNPPRQFTQADLRLATALADRAAPAIENSRLYAQERQLRQQLEELTHRVQEANQRKSAFVTLVSHEFRTPLTSMTGYIELLLEGQGGPLTKRQREWLGIIGNNADRLVMLIDDLLDIARIEAGKIELKRTPLDLVPLIQEVARELHPQLTGKGQWLTLELAEVLPAVMGDADRIRQILANLLSNALKYTPSGGRITITARGEAGRVRVAVQDTGIGLTPEDQAQLFTPFFRAQRDASHGVGGTGLGLAITQALVELHGGAIAVTSAPGQGSTFSVTLPAAQEPAGTATGYTPGLNS
jgi:PAS domain S-box-containing protein